MQVDFFKRKFIDKTDAEEFGLCDDSTEGKTKPAYLDILDREKWIAIVKNVPQFIVEFYPIDAYVSWKRSDGKDPKRCDGMLTYHERKNIIFVELKVCKITDGDWRDDAKKQLKETFEKFFSIYNRSNSQRIEAYICNKRQLLNQRYTALEQNFKNETGIMLRVKREIMVK